MDKSALKELNYDIKKTLEKYQDLRVKCRGATPIEVYGNFRIIDNKGDLQGDFNIRVLISKYYPKGFHHLIETSQKIERIIDRHIDKEGNCCVEIFQKILLIAQRGISVKDFFERYVHKFFCWQLVYEEDPNAVEQWEHYDPGTRQFYYELLGITNDIAVRNCIEAVLRGRIPDRKDKCVCGSGKLTKHCHASDFYDLEKIGREQLIKDLKVFNK
jgi:hypothetical protein